MLALATGCGSPPRQARRPSLHRDDRGRQRGGIVWATGITYLIWYLGVAAEKWMSRASWIALVAAVLVGLLITLLIRRKTGTLVRQAEAEAEAEADLSAVSGAITPETADKEG